MPTQLLIDYLQRSHVNYSLHSHTDAYTAPEIAQNSRVHGANFAKVVMLKINGELSMMVLPAHYHVDMDILRDALGVDSVELATEREFGHRFPRCEVGAMPPFGHLYGLSSYMVPVFQEDADIYFNAGTHSEIIGMGYQDYMRLAYVTEIPEGVIPPGLSPASISQRRPRFRL